MRSQVRAIEPSRDATFDDNRPSRSRPVDLVHLARQTLGDRELEREILGLMVRQMAQCTDRLPLATERERSSLAHAIKGAAQNIGAFALAGKGQAVEDRPADAEAQAALLREMRRTDEFIRILLG